MGGDDTQTVEGELGHHGQVLAALGSISWPRRTGHLARLEHVASARHASLASVERLVVVVDLLVSVCLADLAIFRVPCTRLIHSSRSLATSSKSVSARPSTSLHSAMPVTSLAPLSSTSPEKKGSLGALQGDEGIAAIAVETAPSFELNEGGAVEERTSPLGEHFGAFSVVCLNLSQMVRPLLALWLRRPSACPQRPPDPSLFLAPVQADAD